MKQQSFYRFIRTLATLFLVLVTAGCAGNAPASVSPTTASPIPSSSTPEAAIPLTSAEMTPTAAPVSDPNMLYQDDFTDPATGWPEDKFDNYFIGYHEPEYYHIEISSPNYKTTVFEPEKTSFGDATFELQTFAVSSKTAETGDFRYGLAFRRSGDQYYAFTISPRTKQWFVLKSSPNELTVLAQGSDESIHDLDAADALRVDARGANMFFHINDHLVGQVTDADYAQGEAGFYAETLDAAHVHIHFDTLQIRKFEAPSPESSAVALYKDDFTNPATGWPEKKFDNYFIGYHEPEYYHIEISSANYKTTVFEPEKTSFGDATFELQTFAVSSKTAETGDFRYGLAFRRSGDQYYAFTISPRTKQWYVLKSSPNGLTVLAQGSDESIHGLDAADALRVDARGANMFFHINDHLVGQVTDADYAQGEAGLYAETLDAANVHIHFDTLLIRDVEISLQCAINADTLYVRGGPGKSFTPIGVLSHGDKVEPLGQSADGQWAKITVKDGEKPGWIFISEAFMACNAPIDALPTVNP